MKIEIEEIDYREIMDKLGGIKSAALMAKMGTEREQAIYFNDIIRWAGEITVRLNNGVIMPTPIEAENKKLRELVAEGAKIITILQKEIQCLESEGQHD